MPWTVQDYPVSMKNLDYDVRTKAIEVANALLREGYEEGRAISIGIATAKKWAEHRENDEYNVPERDIHVVPHPDGWALRRATAERASFVFKTMEEARDKGLQMAQTERVNLILHGEDGKFEDHYRAEKETYSS